MQEIPSSGVTSKMICEHSSRVFIFKLNHDVLKYKNAGNDFAPDVYKRIILYRSISTVKRKSPEIRFQAFVLRLIFIFAT
jgi:hypothetical protein